MAIAFLRECADALRMSLRFITQRPGFAAVTFLTLALGIGAPTATFSVIHAVLLRPLPYPEPDRIVRFRLEGRSPSGAVAFDALPAGTAVQWGADSSTLSAISVFNDRALTLSTPSGPFRLTGVAATPNLFELLGVAPAMGRTFEPATRDTRQIVLSHATWQRFFAGTQALVGSFATFDGVEYRIAAVMPEEFHFPTPEAAFWVPLLLDAGGTRGMLLPAVGRLRPDASLAGVLSEGRTLLEDGTDPRRSLTLYVHTLKNQLVGGVQRLLWVLLGAVSLVSTIATANVALLLLVRGATREREFSIRLALGAGRGRLVRQLFAEGVTLALLGGTAGLLLARGMLDLLPHLAPPDMPRVQEATLNGSVLAFALGLTALTSLAFCILSAGRTLTIDPVRTLGGSRGETLLLSASTPRRRLRLLAAGELALTMVLLVGAGLLLRSFVSLVLIDQGFDGRGALAAQITLPPARYPSAAARLAFHDRLLESLKNVEGIDAAGLTTSMPNRQPSARFDYNSAPVPKIPDPLTMQIAEVRMVSEGFFEAMGMPLSVGRTFRAQDGPGAEPVIVISERLARLHFPDRNPVGQLLYSRTGNRRVIGVVADVRPATDFAGSTGAAYIPMRQATDIFDWYAGMNIVARGGDTSALAARVRSLILSLDPEMPPFNVRTLDEEVSRLVAQPRFSASVLAVFAFTALVLAAVGVYGVMAFLAGQRTREIGLRVAVGATRAQVLRLVIRDGLLVLSGGLIAGLLASLWLTQSLTGLLYEVQPTDPMALAFVSAVLSAVSLLAVYLPARRATRVSALDALRSD